MSQWAADPYRRFELRYYDGTRWTEHVSTGGVQSTDAPVATDPFSAQPSATGPFARPGGFGVPPTAPTPYGYQPYSAVAMAARPAASGKLIAAGVLTIIQAAFTLFAALVVFTVANGDGEFLDDISGGAFTLFGLLFLAIGAALLTAGIGCCRSSNWGRILVIVLQSLILLLSLISLANAGGEGGGVVLPLAYCGTALGLAISGKPIR